MAQKNLVWVFLSISPLKFAYLQNFAIKGKKISKFRTKNYLFLISLDIIWKSTASNCSILKILQKQTKRPKSGTKNNLFRIFWARIWKSYCHISNKHNLTKRQLISNFGTKKTLSGYFWVKIFKKILQYLELTSSNLSIWKILWKK